MYYLYYSLYSSIFSFSAQHEEDVQAAEAVSKKKKKTGAVSKKKKKTEAVSKKKKKRL